MLEGWGTAGLLQPPWFSQLSVTVNPKALPVPSTVLLVPWGWNTQTRGLPQHGTEQHIPTGGCNVSPNGVQGLFPPLQPSLLSEAPILQDASLEV